MLEFVRFSETSYSEFRGDLDRGIYILGRCYKDFYEYTVLRFYGFTGLRVYGFTILRFYGFTDLRVYDSTPPNGEKRVVNMYGPSL